MTAILKVSHFRKACLVKSKLGLYMAESHWLLCYKQGMIKMKVYRWGDAKNPAWASLG